MKKIAVSILALFPLLVQAKELKTFSEVAKAVSQGSELVFVVSLQACQGDLPEIKVSVKPNAVLLRGDKFVTASDKHFTLNEPEALGTPVIDYSKYKINSDGQVELHMTIMDARDYHTIAQHTIHCELSKGMQVFSHGRRI